MAYTTTDLAAVQRAIAKGERSVQYDNRMVTYRSTDELLKAEARIIQSLNAAASRSKQTLIVTNKGF